MNININMPAIMYSLHPSLTSFSNAIFAFIADSKVSSISFFLPMISSALP